MNLLLQVQHLLPRCKIFSFRYTQNHNIFIKHLVLFVYPIQQIILIDSSSNCLCMYLLLLYFSGSNNSNHNTQGTLLFFPY